MTAASVTGAGGKVSLTCQSRSAVLMARAADARVKPLDNERSSLQRALPIQQILHLDFRSKSKVFEPDDLISPVRVVSLLNWGGIASSNTSTGLSRPIGSPGLPSSVGAASLQPEKGSRMRALFTSV